MRSIRHIANLEMRFRSKPAFAMRRVGPQPAPTRAGGGLELRPLQLFERQRAGATSAWHSIPSFAHPGEGYVSLAHNPLASRIPRRDEPRPLLDETACQLIEPSIAAAAYRGAIRNTPARLDIDLQGDGALILAPWVVRVGGPTTNPLGGAADWADWFHSSHACGLDCR